MKLVNKVVVVTGAGSGIGRELTLQLLRKGTHVAGVDINPHSLLETQTLAGVGDDRYRAYPLDITDQAQVAQLPAQVVRDFGHVDGLLNNAGIIQPFKLVQDLPLADMQRVFNINFFGTVFLTKAFLPLLLARPEAHIINISSMGGFLPVPGQSVYGASKAAVKLFTEGLYAELLLTSVRVTVVFPGAIATNLMANSGLAVPADADGSDFKPLPAAKAAEAILVAVEQNRFRVLVGQDAKFLDAFYRFHPRRATHFIQQKMKALLAA